MFPINIEKINLKTKDGKYLINDGSILIEKGDFIYLSGKNHSGKSTLLNIINMNQLNDFKLDLKIKIEGRYFTQKDVEEYKQSISYIEQKDLFYFMTPFEEISMEYIKFGHSIDYDEINFLFDYFEISHLKKAKFESKQVDRLSGGEKRKISLIKGFVKKNIKMMIIDEPFNNLDIPSIVKIVNYLYMLNTKKNITIILTSHFNLFVGVNKICELDNTKLKTSVMRQGINGLSWYIERDELVILPFYKD